ncbi:DUF4191 domain-containing protein [Nocardioides sp. Kera G14]|uniref:DUF4191 domain-containing protein n=1 Tax=Nocardioides sp. Kera G14 TaxID=2884264 RepID=UPI001D10FCB5|nr:DUF4191 domain-containing protein [Nocardioides sp. Kera G14]UDY25050.1 DUF4191 domain-containing protein [Nocardioides sp. Kera G14]
MSQLDPTQMSRRQQIVESYRITKSADPKIALWLLLSFVVGAVIGGGLFWLLPGRGIIGTVFTVVGALLGGILLALIVFGRRAQAAAYSRIEGQPGAAAGALNMLRRGWKTEPAVAFNKNQDLVHRVVGPPGIVLIGEGTSPARIKQLLADQRRKHERVVVDVPVHELIVGNGEGQVPLPKLTKTVMKLGRNVRGADITDILNRVKALDAVQGKVPLPKGPVPTSMKGQRSNLRGR